MATDLTPLSHSVVRVLSTDRVYAGLGYRVSAELVITCAHVVAEALGTDPKGTQPPSGQVLLDVPFAADKQNEIQVPAVVVVPGGWLPVDDGNRAADLALLQVSGGPDVLPFPGPPADLYPADSLTGKIFHAYGGPGGHERHLIHIQGQVQAPIGNSRWQLSARDSDFLIEPGCSGAPAVDEHSGRVIGLIAQDERDPKVRAGFLIPANHLRSVIAAAVLPRSAAPGLELLRRWLDAQLGGASTTITDPVRRFIDDYAGTPDRPMPFAGREGALNALDQHLAVGAGALLLVSGAAGLGKSALLLHWMARQLREPPTANLSLLFLPVSIRFGTAEELRGLRLVHTQLATLFTEVAFPEGSKPDQEDYRDRIAAGWQIMARRPGERFLLVVDGVDEASRLWLTDRVIPHTIPTNLTVVLAARHKPGHGDGRRWLDDFPVAPECPTPHVLELEPLSREAVGEAVSQLGHPLDALPEREGILDALYHLTDHGDPLLVSLWTGQLWTARKQAETLTASEMARFQPGYRGFVDVWLKEQAAVWKSASINVHMDDFRRLLRVLAIAHGPLHLQDWLAVMVRLSVHVPWDFSRAREVLDSAYRVVVGNAERHGYTFVHPRLADHFKAELEGIKDERIAVPRAYLDWGSDTVAALNSGILPHEQCPSYLLHHYTTHVLGAGLSPEEVLKRHLLALLREGWHRAWYEEEGAYGGYLADIKRVQVALHKANAIRSGPPYQVGPVLRCLMIRASIRSQTENLWPDLIVALADAGVWTASRAAKVAGELPDRVASIQALVGLTARLSEVEHRQRLCEALAAARGIGNEESRVNALAAVAGQLEGKARSQVLGEALAAARSIGNEESRVNALAAVAGQLEGEACLQVLNEALAAARGIGNEESRAKALAAVAGQLEGKARSQVQYEELAAARSIDKWSCSEALAAVAGQIWNEEWSEVLDEVDEAGQLAGEARSHVQDEALAAARSIHNEESRVNALAAVAGQLAGEARSRVQYEALAAARGIGDKKSRAKALAAVAGQLEGKARSHVLDEALAAARNIGDEESRAIALAAVAGQLAGEARSHVQDEALAAAHSIRDEQYRAKALTAVAGQLGGEPALLGESLAAARSIADEQSRAKVLAAVAGQLADMERAQVQYEALVAARSIHNEEYRAKALTAVAGQLTGEARSQVLGEALAAARSNDIWSRTTAVAAARGIGNEESRAKALAAVAGQLAGETRSRVQYEALTAARGIGDKKSRAKALAAVAGQLAGETRSRVLGEALTAARGIGNEESRAKALAAMAGQLAGEARSQVLGEALVAARSIGDEQYRAKVLAAVAGQLGGEPALLGEALAAARSIDDEQYRAKVLAAVAGQLAGEARSQVLGEALAAARNIGDEESRAMALAAVAGQLADEALAAAHGIHDKKSRAMALAAVAGQLAGEARSQVLDEALVAARSIADEESRAKVLAAVAGQLGDEPALLGEALAAARDIGDEESRAMALAAVAGQLAGMERSQVLGEALTAARGIRDEESRAEALAAVAGQLSGKARSRVLTQALVAARDTYDGRARAEALAAVAGQLSGKARSQVLGEALAAARSNDRWSRTTVVPAGPGIRDEESRAKALTAVAGQIAGMERSQVLGEALAAARKIGDEESRAEALGAVAGQLAGDGALAGAGRGAGGGPQHRR